MYRNVPDQNSSPDQKGLFQGLTVLDDETINWLPNPCSLDLVWPSSGLLITCSNNEEEGTFNFLKISKVPLAEKYSSSP